MHCAVACSNFPAFSSLYTIFIYTHIHTIYTFVLVCKCVCHTAFPLYSASQKYFELRVVNQAALHEQAQTNREGEGKREMEGVGGRETGTIEGNCWVNKYRIDACHSRCCLHCALGCMLQQRGNNFCSMINMNLSLSTSISPPLSHSLCVHSLWHE